MMTIATRFPVLLLATALLATAASAAEPQASATEPQVYRLAPDDIVRAQVDGAARRDVFDPSQWPVQADKQVHGEVGAFVGTGGARGVFGSAVVPLGDNATAAFSFEKSQIGDGNRRRYPY